MADSEFLYHVPCEACGSSDAGAFYSDGHTHCHKCGARSEGEPDETPERQLRTSGLIQEIRYQSLSTRRLNEATCRKFGYGVARLKGKPVQVADYHDADGAVVAQKIRFPNKDFSVLGDMKKACLFGQHLWRDGGKKVVITEGEVDALSMSQAQANKWPVVSVPSGAPAAKTAIKKAIEWLEKFEEVVFMFDNDDAGRAAAAECAQLLTPGKAKIASLPLKDASDMLVAGRVAELLDAMWDARVYRPDGIVCGEAVWQAITSEDNTRSVEYPYPGLTRLTRGLRGGELVTFGAGSGVGKSTVCRETAAHLIRLGETVGYIALEESVKRSALGLLGIELNQPLHLEPAPEAVMRSAWEGMNERVYFYDHWGSLESDNLLSRIRYLVRGCGCSFVFLDHLSIVVSGIDNGDERKSIDVTMTRLRSLVEETGVGLVLVSHLKRPSGQGHEEGASVSLSDFRGSASIAQLSDIVIGVERNLQDDEMKNVATARVLKNRYSGETGLACHMRYDAETARLSETDLAFEVVTTAEPTDF